MSQECVAEWAGAVAEGLLAPLGRRWDHVQAVARRAARIAPGLGSDAADTLVAAAYLHDIGYAPELAATGFHPLDGGRFVRSQGYEFIARLVAHHSGARIEAELRGITGYTTEFPFDDGPLDQALTFCDLTTGPDGSPVSLAFRVAEINERYGPDQVTARAITAGVPEFERACRLTRQRLADNGLVVLDEVGEP